MLQKKSGHEAVRKEGCCFLCCCYKGGLNIIQEADDCFYWALEKKKVKGDAYVLIDKDTFANEIAERYNRNVRPVKFVKGIIIFISLINMEMKFIILLVLIMVIKLNKKYLLF